MNDRTGQLFGNYRLIHLLGQGGFADVYLGEHVHLNTHAAIKVLRTQLTNEDVVHFRSEARNLAHLVHPHIVQVLDFGVEGDTPFLVMMYAPNGTLRQSSPTGCSIASRTYCSVYTTSRVGTPLRASTKVDPPGYQAGKHVAWA